MVKKELIREELLRIQEIMGIKQSFVNEAVSPVFMSKALVKQILKNSENLPETLRKIFNATDQQVDLITSRIDDVGGVENLTDDLLEGLAKKTIDNVDDLVKLLKAGNFFGSDFKLISKGIFDKIDTFVEISPNTRIKVIEYYKKSLDDLPFLENADEIKGKLVRDFQSEFDEKFAERITKGVGSSIDDVYDAFLNTDIVSDIPENAIPKNSRDILERSITDYKNFIRNAKKKGFPQASLTKAEYDKLMLDFFSQTKRIDDRVYNDIKEILKKEPSWWVKKPWWAKLLMISGLIGFGPELATLILWGVVQKYSNLKNPAEIWNFLDGLFGTKPQSQLDTSSVERWFETNYPARYVDSSNFEENFKVVLNNTKTGAVIESKDGYEEWQVKLQDGKIIEI